MGIERARNDTKRASIPNGWSWRAVLVCVGEHDITARLSVTHSRVFRTLTQTHLVDFEQSTVDVHDLRSFCAAIRSDFQTLAHRDSEEKTKRNVVSKAKPTAVPRRRRQYNYPLLGFRSL